MTVSVSRRLNILCIMDNI